MSAIEIHKLKKSYGSTHAVKDVSFTVNEGEIFGFLGPNGAGKTTTIRCMMDFLRPDEGEIIMLGQNAQRDSVTLKNHIGFLPAEVNLFEHWTGLEHIRFAVAYGGDMELANELTNRLDYNPQLTVKKLSTGNKQKLGFILSFMKKPKLLILDEPTSGLDPILQHTIYELLTEYVDKGNTVFMSSHNLTEVDKLCDRVGIIRKGEMVAVEEITTLKKKMLYQAKVQFSEKFNKEEFSHKGLEIQKEQPDGAIELSVKGDLNDLVRALSNYAIKDLEVTHASLEDVFLEFYQ